MEAARKQEQGQEQGSRKRHIPAAAGEMEGILEVALGTRILVVAQKVPVHKVVVRIPVVAGTQDTVRVEQRSLGVAHSDRPEVGMGYTRLSHACDAWTKSHYYSNTCKTKPPNPPCNTDQQNHSFLFFSLLHETTYYYYYGPSWPVKYFWSDGCKTCSCLQNQRWLNELPGWHSFDAYVSLQCLHPSPLFLCPCILLRCLVLTRDSYVHFSWSSLCCACVSVHI